MVRDGNLPPVEERLPANPLVVDPVERLGPYGGELRTALLGPTDTGWIGRTIGYEHLVRWDQKNYWNVLSNVAESFEIADDGAAYVFRLRKGLKWSDGEPFVADDVVFAYEAVINNETLAPEGPPTWMTPGGQPGTVERVDESTVRFTFEGPNGLLLVNLASSFGNQFTALPRHYLEQFHADYNPDVDELVKEEDVPDWTELFFRKSDVWQNVDLPTLHAWVVTAPLGTGQTVVAERNPYYWKTDTEGRQLPYVDRWIYEISSDAEVLLLNVLNGEIDLHFDYFNTLSNKPVVVRSQQDGDYRLLDMVPAGMNDMAISLNLTHENPVKREIFLNKDFRIGLSHAIDRQEIIDSVFREQGEPWQEAPRPEERDLYSEELAKQYTEYDVDLANEFLDRAGYGQRDSDGFRLGPDGERISFAIETAPDFRIEHVDGLELVQQYWEEVGIDMRVRSESSDLLGNRRIANQHDGTAWDSGGAWKADAFLRPYWYMPFPGTHFAVLWADWYGTGGEAGEEPPGPPRRQMELLDQIQATIDEEEQIRLMKEILRIAQEEFYVMGTSLPPQWYGIAKNRLRNVLVEGMRDGGTYVAPASANTSPYFIADD